MKPFITPELMSNGRKVFKYQCEGINPDDLSNTIRGKFLHGYFLPKGHSFSEAWELSLFFDSDLEFQFSSASTDIGNWQEVGSLNIRLLRNQMKKIKKDEVRIESSIEKIDIEMVEKLIYEDQDIVVECGLLLRSQDGREAVIAAGIPPGSVSMMAPFSSSYPFEPQFSISTCRREAI